ncbi:MAG: PD40 domain-containing protein [Gemmatimonadetes bacterium]|nr:PD40 domain-containing protein [Gemmatimonadota bacterium]
MIHLCRVALALVLATSVLPNAAAAQDDGWRTIEFETSEVTTPDVALSPDGEWLIFTMLGHLFRLPVEGGTAEQLTFGPYYDTDPVFSPDGVRVAFVSDRDGSEGNVFVVDLSTGAITQVTQEPWAARPTWTPDGRGIVYLRMVREVLGLTPLPRHSLPDLVSAQVRRVALSGGAPETLTDEPRVIGSVFHLPDGRVGWAMIDLDIDEATIRASTRIEIMNADGAVTHLATLGGYAAPVVPSPRGDGFYYRRFAPVLRWSARPTDDDLGFLSLQDGAEQRLMTLSPHRGWSPRFAVTADGASLYMGSRGRIWKMALPSGVREPIAFSATVRHDLKDPVTPQKVAFLAGDSVKPLSILEPRMSPDGSTLVFGAAGHLWSQSLDGGEAQRLFDGSALERAPAFSPDGRQLAFVRTERGQEEVRILDFDSGVVRTVTSGLSYWGLGWSPDGQRLVYVESQRSGNRIVELDLSTGETKQVIDVRFRRVVRPHFSANGQSIFFSDGDPGEENGRLFRLSLEEDAEPMPVSPPELVLARALVSPDGRWIAFMRSRTRISIARVREGASVKAEDVLQLSPAWFDVGGLDTFMFTPDSSAVVYAVGSRLWRHPIGGGEREEIPIRLQLRGPTPPPLLLRRVRVLDFPSGGFGSETSVFIEGGRIRAIGPEAERSVPPETLTIDADGRFAIPGLFDMHQHYSWMIGDAHGDSWDRDRGFDPLQVFIAYGLTSARELGGQLAFVNALVDRTQTTSDPLPRWFSSGDIFEGRETFTSIPLRIRNEVEARDYVRLWKEWGAHFIKVYPSLSWPLQRAVAEEARLQGLPVVGHGSNGVEEMVKSVTLGYTSVEHNLPDRPYDDLLQLLAASETRWEPTLLTRTDLLSDEPERLNDPKLRSFYPQVAGQDYLRSAFLRMADGRERNLVWLAGVRDAHQRGVTLLAGTDRLPGASLHWELELLTRAGIPPLEVLRIATQQAAEAVGAADDLGTLEPGKLADIVLLDANPLEDIRNTQTIWRVIKGGWVFDPEALRPERN